MSEFLEEFEDDPRPAGKQPVTFDIMIPTTEQVTREIARQIIVSSGFYERRALENLAREKITLLINDAVTLRALNAIEDALEKAFQPTDEYGNPTGPAKTLHAVIGEAIKNWTMERVDRNGNPSRETPFGSKTTTRVEWAIRQIVNSELTTAINQQLDTFVAEMKAGATQTIAKQIAEKISGLVLK